MDRSRIIEVGKGLQDHWVQPSTYTQCFPVFSGFTVTFDLEIQSSKKVLKQNISWKICSVYLAYIFFYCSWFYEDLFLYTCSARTGADYCCCSGFIWVCGKREWGRSDQNFCCMCCVSSGLSTPSWGCKSLEEPSAHRRQWMGGVLKLALSWAGKNWIFFFKFCHDSSDFVSNTNDPIRNVPEVPLFIFSFSSGCWAGRWEQHWGGYLVIKLCGQLFVFAVAPSLLNLASWVQSSLRTTCSMLSGEQWGSATCLAYLVVSEKTLHFTWATSLFLLCVTLGWAVLSKAQLWVSRFISAWNIRMSSPYWMHWNQRKTFLQTLVLQKQLHMRFYSRALQPHMWCLTGSPWCVGGRSCAGLFCCCFFLFCFKLLPCKILSSLFCCVWNQLKWITALSILQCPL